jgi:hypothetical protein
MMSRQCEEPKGARQWMQFSSTLKLGLDCRVAALRNDDTEIGETHVHD